jgi:hypothetical protein
MKFLPLSLLVPLTLLAGCGGNNEPAQRTQWVPEGPPVACIQTSQIRSMRVVDDRTIDFEMTGRRVFRNDLPMRCPGLAFNTAVRHNSRTSQLCSANSITPRSPGGGWGGPGCPLGRFQPLVRAPAPAEAG